MSEPALYLGFDIGGTNVRAALGHGAEIVASRTAVWPSGLAPADEVVFVADLAHALIDESGQQMMVRAAGVALAALTDRDGRVVDWPNRPAWRGLQFRSLLTDRLGLPTIVEDDANAAALAEYAVGSAQGFAHVVVITVGTGIGAGLILDGSLVRGRHGWAGELGHLVMQRDGPACACGHKGCLQMLASGRALERIAVARGLLDAAALTEAAAQGEDWALEALAESGRWLGLAAANVVNLLDLDAVVIGGGLSALDEPWWSALQASLETNLLSPTERQVSLRRAMLPDTAGLLGALYLAQQHKQQHSGEEQ
ncbi:MAG TPA: ROK family protein [Herpetosiphonaceae bacterium]